MADPGKGREFLDVLARCEQAGGKGSSNVRHYAFDGRALPLRLAAEALQAMEAWDPFTNALPPRAELHRCTGALLCLREQLPPAARRHFDALDDGVQAILLSTATDPATLAAARGQLVERICALGNSLAAALWTEDASRP